MQFVPTLEEYTDLAGRYPVVPVSVRVLADRETAVSAFEKLVGDAPGFLFESVEGGDRWARWSFLGWDPEFTLISRDGVTYVEGKHLDLAYGNPLEVLEDLLTRFATPELAGLPPLHSGAVGYLGYDCVRYIEDLPGRPPDDRGVPEMLWQFVGSLAALDRFDQTITLVRNVFTGSDPVTEYHGAVRALEEAAAVLSSGRSYVTRPAPAPTGVGPAPRSTMDRATFEQAVEKAKRYIEQGDAFQIVLSQRLETPFFGDSFAVYRSLRLLNPSPYLFYVKHPDVTVVGSSPELLTRVRDGRVYSRPIAGTRRRGADDQEDAALEVELLADPKERAEHIMLVDLARNDLGRVAEFGSVVVDDLMVVERYSHVMHIVSGVSGRLRSDIRPIDVVRAVFPHGTVSGAPKVRAMEIIDELEPVARGPYAGAVGYFDFSGNIDTAICLRTVVIAAEKAWVQAGAGLVADSDAAAEYEETMDKAAAALAAIEGAGTV
ncbi:MAG: anthranilate synthase component I [Acidimicrobiia bacterium]|nr:anthranilate synthase component I [Acidimicrobiia bacterium]MDH3398315.1 anthranilate synthase component I [Acidimicrobiia bacterium]